MIVVGAVVELKTMTEVPKALFMIKDIERSKGDWNKGGGWECGIAVDMNLTKQGFLQEDGRVVKETTKKYIKKGIMARLISFVLYSLPHFKKGLEVGIIN